MNFRKLLPCPCRRWPSAGAGHAAQALRNLVAIEGVRDNRWSATAWWSA
jgi:hypothetical protein